MSANPPKLLSARQRISAALMQANLTPNKSDQPDLPDVLKKKKKGAVSALLAATGKF